MDFTMEDVAKEQVLIPLLSYAECDKLLQNLLHCLLFKRDQMLGFTKKLDQDKCIIYEYSTDGKGTSIAQMKLVWNGVSLSKQAPTECESTLVMELWSDVVDKMFIGIDTSDALHKPNDKHTYVERCDFMGRMSKFMLKPVDYAITKAFLNGQSTFLTTVTYIQTISNIMCFVDCKSNLLAFTIDHAFVINVGDCKRSKKNMGLKSALKKCLIHIMTHM